MIKTVYGAFIENFQLYICEKTESGLVERKVDLFLSSESYYKAREITNSFWEFYYEVDMSLVKSFELFIELSGIRYPAKYYFMPHTAFFENAKRNMTLVGNY